MRRGNKVVYSEIAPIYAIDEKKMTQNNRIRLVPWHNNAYFKM